MKAELYNGLITTQMESIVVKNLVDDIKKLETEIDDIYCELRGLLKEHAQFPKQWDTNARLIEWLKERNQY